ncbi:hypothetical protein [Chelativorans intermedius]|uniref:Uncharacterized protein n=1 Tax=Chelativorans intermedius TaxID=515947 RepID=A0ABV6DDF5_9HYPH|nr:hypothetical protein [Chelativorans intermedius]MCT9000701.1 hypothetical protein [Chelativorans intermedius]
MPVFTIETTYHLPVYRQRVYEAETLEMACKLALEDEDWQDEETDIDAAGERYVTGAWEGSEAYSGPAFAIPERFAETVQRKAELFDELLEVLREPARVMDLTRDQFAH